MSYEEFIEDILNNRGRHCVDGYCEIHHILPRCLGGVDNDNNLISLTAKEHYIAHKLLAEENPNNAKLIYAWWAMSNMDRYGKRYELTSDEYEEVKLKHIQHLSKQVYCLERKEIFDSIHQASKELNLTVARICDCCNFNQIACNNMHFMFKADFDKLGLSEEQCIKMLEDERKEGGVPKKPIICLETSEIFEHAKIAALKYGNTVSIGAINACCRKQNKTAYGKHFMFIEDFVNLGLAILDSAKYIENIENERKYGGIGSKEVLCLETNEIFKRTFEIVQQYKCCRSSIANCCTHRSKTAAGKHWIYLDEFKHLGLTNQECIEKIDNKEL